MAIVIESSQTATAGSTDTLTITKPTGLAVGDLMSVTLVNWVDSTARTWDTLAGWSVDDTVVITPGSVGSDKMAVTKLYKVADSGDVAASNFIFTTSGTAASLHGFLMRVSGTRTDTEFGASDNEKLNDTNNPSYTVSLAPAQDNVLYLAVFMSGGPNYLATDTTINGTNPTWTSQYTATVNNDADLSVAVFTAIDASPESSVTTLTPTETGSSAATDSAGLLSFYLGQNGGNTTPTFTFTTNTAFAPSGQAGAQTTPVFTETTNEAFAPGGIGTSPTNWTNATKPSTTWTNTDKD